MLACISITLCCWITRECIAYQYVVTLNDCSNSFSITSIQKINKKCSSCWQISNLSRKVNELKKSCWENVLSSPSDHFYVMIVYLVSLQRMLAEKNGDLRGYILPPARLGCCSIFLFLFLSPAAWNSLSISVSLSLFFLFHSASTNHPIPHNLST